MTKQSYTFEFNYPTQLKQSKDYPNPMERVSRLMEDMHRKIGYEQLTMRIQKILTQWGLESGYYVESKDGKHFTFNHVSL